MTGKITFVLLLIITFLVGNMTSQASTGSQTGPESEITSTDEPTKLLIMFTSEDKEVFTKMVTPYALNSMRQGWWEHVNLLIWGPSNRLVATDEEVQGILREMKETGVELTACLWCAEQYDLDEKLTELGVDVKYMGQPLTEMLKTDWKVLTF